MITRKTAAAEAIVLLAISAALFVLKPLPPYGEDAAFYLLFVAACCVFVAIFPRVALQIGAWLGKDNADHLGRWVP